MRSLCGLGDGRKTKNRYRSHGAPRGHGTSSHAPLPPVRSRPLRRCEPRYNGTNKPHHDNVGGCCGMVKSRADLTPFSAVLGSEQHAFVAAAVVRRRVRQRACSSALQQAPAAAARRQLLTATTDYHGGANGAAATIGERRTVGPVRVSSKSSNGGSGGNEVYTSRNRMMTAAKRRRWTEVQQQFTSRGSRENVAVYHVSANFDLMLVCGRKKSEPGGGGQIARYLLMVSHTPTIC